MYSITLLQSSALLMLLTTRDTVHIAINMLLGNKIVVVVSFDVFFSIEHFCFTLSRYKDHSLNQYIKFFL